MKQMTSHIKRIQYHLPFRNTMVLNKMLPSKEMELSLKCLVNTGCPETAFAKLEQGGGKIKDMYLCWFLLLPGLKGRCASVHRVVFCYACLEGNIQSLCEWSRLRRNSSLHFTHFHCTV